MEKLVQGNVIAALVLCAAPAERPQFIRRSGDNREAIGEIGTQGFADKFGAGPILSFAKLFDLFSHSLRKGNSNSARGSHNDKLPNHIISLFLALSYLSARNAVVSACCTAAGSLSALASNKLTCHSCSSEREA